MYPSHEINLHLFAALFRRSNKRCSIKKNLFRNFTKFIGKHLCQGLFFNKVAGLNFIKKETLAQVFSCEFRKIFKNTFFTEHLWTTASNTHGVYGLLPLFELLQTSQLASDLIQGACRPKPKIEDDVQVLQSAETIDKVPIFNIFVILTQKSFAEKGHDDDKMNFNCL